MDLMKMMKQAQEIQGRMQQMQEELAGMEVEGQSGAGLVTVSLTGKLDLRSLKIDPVSGDVIGDKEAARLYRREHYRAPFVVPDKV